MSKPEALLLIMVVVILLASFWFIFSGQIWVLVSYLETLLYPTFSTPQ